MIHGTREIARTRFKRAISFFACFGFLACSAIAQTGPEPDAKARDLLARARAALGEEVKSQKLRSLALNGKFTRSGRSGKSQGEFKIEILAPDKILRTEDSHPQSSIYLTTFQTMNGDRVWFDRKITRPSRDDGNQQIATAQGGVRTSPISVENRGMRGTVEGETSVRTNPPGTRNTERSVLGMPIPTPAGQDSNSELDKIERDRRVSAQTKSRSPLSPNIQAPDLKNALEQRIRRELAGLMFAILLSESPAFPLKFKYAGEIQASEGKIEAIDLSGPDGFEGRLFIDQATSRPSMLSYREFIDRKAGVVLNAQDETRQEDLQEIAVQLYFLDYRAVKGSLFPFHIVTAINGAPVDEWKIEKYKINPDLNAKKFEKGRR